jgi:hypothetical protein
MSDKKTIQINPELFNYSNNTTKKKREKVEKKIKVKESKPANNKTLRGKLLRYIREQQENNYKKMSGSSATPNLKHPISDSEFDSQFNESVAFLQKYAEDHDKKGTGLNKTFKNHETNSMLFQPNMPLSELEDVNIDFPMETDSMKIPLLPQPTYGCLKGGKLPTYRTWQNQTRKNTQRSESKSHINTSTSLPAYEHYAGPPVVLPQNPSSTQEASIIPAKDNGVSHLLKHNANKIENAKKMSEIKQLISKSNPAKSKQSKLKYIKQKKTLKRTFHVGKSKVFPRIGVLVSNKTIRKNTTTKTQLLKQISIEDVKRFLLKKGFIKIGSTAPNDVLRKMYESIMLICGDVQNHNPDNLLYNFFNDK